MSEGMGVKRAVMLSCRCIASCPCCYMYIHAVWVVPLLLLAWGPALAASCRVLCGGRFRRRDGVPGLVLAGSVSDCSR
jgi:hypothetical protein